MDKREKIKVEEVIVYYNLHEQPELKYSKPEDKKEENVKKFVELLQRHNQDKFWPKHDNMKMRYIP